MKNSFFIKIIFIILVFFNKSIAEDLLINANEVNIVEKGKIIEAAGSVEIIDTNNEIKINGNSAKYDKQNQNVEIKGNVVFFDKLRNINVKSNLIVFERNEKKLYTYENTEINLFDNDNDKIRYNIKSNDAFIDQKKELLEFNQNVEFKDFINNYEIFTDKIEYDKINELIKTFNNTEIKYKDNFIIQSTNIFFDRNINLIYSKENTIIKDKFKNKFKMSSFNLDLDKNIFKSKGLKLNDEGNNELKLENALINIDTNEIIGSDFEFKFDKKLFGNSKNDPRFIGRYLITNKSETSMKKSKFTTCENIPGKCPSWSISASEVKHKKEAKRIEYKNAWLHIHDMPVVYFPYFFHPDPTVNRQSGFLFPRFMNNSNLGFSTQIPYYVAIDVDKDLTISPRVYSNNNLFLQTEYRQDFANSNLITDFSYNKKNNSNSHFFLNLVSDFKDSFSEIRIETVSNKDYLKKYQIQSPLINNYSTLNSSFIISEETDEYRFSSSIDVIEDLTKPDNDRFEYIFPNYEFEKEIFFEDMKFDSLNYKSSGSYRKFNTNIDELDLINDFVLQSNSINIFDNTESEFSLLFRNINTYGDLSQTYKDKKSYSLLSSVLYNFKYPLSKETDKENLFLTPIASLRYSPNKGLNKRDQKTFIGYKDLFNLDRIDGKTVEEGAAVTLGLEYKNQNKLNDIDNFNFGLGVNLRLDEDEDIPLSTSLNKKTSDIIGYSGLNISENLSINYNFSIDQNLSETNYSLVSADYSGNKFKTSFEYMEKSNFIGDESYFKNITEIKLNNSNLIAFETNKNIDKNMTDYYDIIYKYNNDCLEASVVYNKQFYQEDNVNSNKNIFFKISFLPFGELSSPNLNE